MTESEAQKHFANAPRIAIVGGAVSGNLECLDFDDPDTYEPFLELLELRCPGLHARLLKRRTPSGGYHVVYRCTEPVAGNLKLAMKPIIKDDGKPGEDVRIETRGEGGYFLVPPSPGYEIISGSLKDCPALSGEEVREIHNVAKMFDERKTSSTPTNTRGASGGLPGSLFNEAHTAEDILQAQEWREDKPTTAGMGWTRPGKESGTSGVLLKSTGNFYCWSSNAYPLEAGRSYDAFGLFVMFNHGGDFSAAARELAGSAPRADNPLLLLPANLQVCNLDEASDDIQRLRAALGTIPKDTQSGKHDAGQIIGFGLRHSDSGIKTHIGAALASEWDQLTGGKSMAVFTECDPNFNYTKPVTVASIYDLAQKNGWDGQAPWGIPEPLIGHSEAAPYPLESLPEIIRGAVQEVNDFVQAPVAITACSALTAVSLVAQGHADVRRAVKLEGPCSIFPLAVADSGERKTTVDGFFTKPIKLWESEQRDAATPFIQEYNAARRIWDATQSGLLTSIKDYAKSDKDPILLEQKLIDLEKNEPKPPMVPRMIYTDATPEALAAGLAAYPTAGVISSEAGVVFGGHAMGKDSSMRNMGMLNSLWDGDSFTIDRKTGPSFSLSGVRLTMGLAVQPEAIRSFLDDSKGLARGIGWLARFLVAWPESTQGNRPFREAPEHWPNLSRFHQRISALLEIPLPFNEEGRLEPAMLELSPDAKKMWVKLHDEIEDELRPGHDMAETRDVASKTADNAARLAALFHIFERGLDGTINADCMERAGTIATWHLYESRRFMEEMAVPLETSNAVKLDEWMLGYCRENRVEEIPRRLVQQLGPGSTRGKANLDGAVNELIETGRARIVKQGKRRIIQVNPALLEVI